MLILGIDPGVAHLGWARLDSRDARIRGAGHVATHKGDAVGDTQRRLDEIIDALVAPIESADLVVVEWSSVSGGGFQREGDGSAHGNARSAALNACAATAAKTIARVRGIAVLEPAPITWRSAIGTARGADELLHARLARFYPKTAARFRAGQRPHVFDAIGLALFGRLYATNPMLSRNRG